MTKNLFDSGRWQNQLAGSYSKTGARCSVNQEDVQMYMHQTFDWIFFAIVGIPLVVAIVDLVKMR
jgi:hypothetical protein